MNKYIITKSAQAQLSKKEDVLIAGAKILLDIGAAGLPGAAVGGGIMAGVAVGKWMRDASVTKITSQSELSDYRNCISPYWKTNVLYYEHPYMNKVLIEAALYKDFILRDMVADIADYIMDNLDLSKIVIGLVVTGKKEAKGTVPIKKINADAHIDCNLSKKFMISMKDSHTNPDSTKEYIWVKQFPDVISAVEHKVGHFEVCKSVQMNLDAGGGIKGIFNASFKGNKEYEFYISYDKA